MQVRINKYISDSGYCSRREADKYIEQGCVTIDGDVAEVGSRVSPGQVVKIFGETISHQIKSVLIAYNKPVGVVSTTDPDERNNIISAIGHNERIFPIGRLDKDSQGLILLTNDGNIVNKILRVNNNHDKEYLVTVNKMVTADFINRMENGVPILGVMTRKCVVTKKSQNSFTIVLRQGLNRQIRRMCEYLGYNVTKLQRTRIMHIHLGDLKIGQYRNLTPQESDTLYKMLATSVKTEEASARKKRTAKPQPSKSASAKPESTKSPSAKAFSGKAPYKGAPKGKSSATAPKSDKPASGKFTSYRPKGKSTKRSNTGRK